EGALRPVLDPLRLGPFHLSQRDRSADPRLAALARGLGVLHRRRLHRGGASNARWWICASGSRALGVATVRLPAGGMGTPRGGRITCITKRRSPCLLQFKGKLSATVHDFSRKSCTVAESLRSFQLLMFFIFRFPLLLIVMIVIMVVEVMATKNTKTM